MYKSTNKTRFHTVFENDTKSWKLEYFLFQINKETANGKSLISNQQGNRNISCFFVMSETLKCTLL